MRWPSPILLLALAVGCASSGPTPGPSTAVATPAPDERAGAPTPTPVPSGPVPEAVPRSPSGPAIRVLLRKTKEPMDFPQPGRAYRATSGDEALWLWGPLNVTTSAETAWQVGAWSDPATAKEVADRLSDRLGDGVTVWQEPADGGLVRVRVRWVGDEPGNAGDLVAAAGFEAAYRVSGAGSIRIRGVGGSMEATKAIVLTPADEWPTVTGGRSYRGRFVLRIAGGELLIVNELRLENYLRGVVPVEMGPYQFPELEALKAQAVAARTYAVAHLGDHDDEGWDICATPACQAYHGVGAEHSLTDRAVRETAGVIATFDGRPIDAMYTSTCGGHTEDAAELFPARAQRYLTGVACAWDRPLRLTGTEPSGRFVDRVAHAATVARQVLGLTQDASPGEVLRSVAERSGVTADVPAAIDVESFAVALLTASGIQASPSLTRVETGLESLLVLCDLYDFNLPPPTDGLEGDWPAAAALAVLELSGEVVRDRGDAVPHPDGVAIYPHRAAASEPLSSPLPLWERWSDGYRRIAEAEMLPGAELERIRVDRRVAALVVRRSGGADEADRRSSWRSWIRERTWTELQTSLGTPDLARIEVARRGASGRVVALGVVDGHGDRRLVEGFDVRRALDLPETLFEMHARTLPSGERVVRFLGRGWGHGVGFCQNGAYGLARAGMSFEGILEHYYTGIELTEWDRPD